MDGGLIVGGGGKDCHRHCHRHCHGQGDGRDVGGCMEFHGAISFRSDAVFFSGTRGMLDDKLAFPKDFVALILWAVITVVSAGGPGFLPKI